MKWDYYHTSHKKEKIVACKNSYKNVTLKNDFTDCPRHLGFESVSLQTEHQCILKPTTRPIYTPGWLVHTRACTSFGL
jgi:hypothetical protein